MFRLRVRKVSPIPQEPIECPLNIGYLGKIPQRDDFIELNARSREVQDLDACLKQWYLDTHRRGVDPRSAYQHFGFVATGGHDRQGLAGHFYSSSDRYDRAYPILYFARWSSVSMYFRPAVLFHATEQTLPSLSSAANSLQAPDMDFLANLNQLAEQPNPLIAENPVLDAMGGLTLTYLNDWLKALAGEDSSLWHEWLQTRTCDILRYIHSVKTTADYTLRLPLGQNSLTNISILFWLHVLESSLHGQHWRPDILWSSEKNQNFLYILSKPLTTSQFDQIICDKLSTDISIQLHMSIPIATTARRISELILKDPAKSLLDIAIQWSRASS